MVKRYKYFCKISKMLDGVLNMFLCPKCGVTCVVNLRNELLKAYHIKSPCIFRTLFLSYLQAVIRLCMHLTLG